MAVRRAEARDLNDINRLLYEVAGVHAAIRPDLFVNGSKKYTDEELLKIIGDDTRPIFVYESGAKVSGYAFCEIENLGGAMRKHSSLYIDDLCVDKEARGGGIGKALFEHVKAYAKCIGCDYITLNVWEGNDGVKAFYERMGLTTRKTTMETKL